MNTRRRKRGNDSDDDGVDALLALASASQEEDAGENIKLKGRGRRRRVSEDEGDGVGRGLQTTKTEGKKKVGGGSQMVMARRGRKRKRVVGITTTASIRSQKMSGGGETEEKEDQPAGPGGATGGVDGTRNTVPIHHQSAGERSNNVDDKLQYVKQYDIDIHPDLLLEPDADAVVKKGIALRHLLDTKGHGFPVLEFFYSGLDKSWYKDGCMSSFLKHMNIDANCLTRPEWWAVRSLLGRPRRLSSAFLRDARGELALLRVHCEEVHADDKLEKEGSQATNMSEPLKVGQHVVAKHPAIGELHDGVLLTVYQGKCRVQFDKRELGVHLVRFENIMEKPSVSGRYRKAMEHQKTSPELDAHMSNPSRLAQLAQSLDLKEMILSKFLLHASALQSDSGRIGKLSLETDEKKLQRVNTLLEKVTGKSSGVGTPPRDTGNDKDYNDNDDIKDVDEGRTKTDGDGLKSEKDGNRHDETADIVCTKVQKIMQACQQKILMTNKKGTQTDQHVKPRSRIPAIARIERENSKALSKLIYGVMTSLVVMADPSNDHSPKDIAEMLGANMTANTALSDTTKQEFLDLYSHLHHLASVLCKKQRPKGTA